jgi:hypothetical protein
MNACGALLASRSLSLLMEITIVPTPPTNDELTVYQVALHTDEGHEILQCQTLHRY